jgi:hypothetical protein
MFNRAVQRGYVTINPAEKDREGESIRGFDSRPRLFSIVNPSIIIF